MDSSLRIHMRFDGKRRNGWTTRRSKLAHLPSTWHFTWSFVVDSIQHGVPKRGRHNLTNTPNTCIIGCLHMILMSGLPDHGDYSTSPSTRDEYTQNQIQTTKPPPASRGRNTRTTKTWSGISRSARAFVSVSLRFLKCCVDHCFGDFPTHGYFGRKELRCLC